MARFPTAANIEQPQLGTSVARVPGPPAGPDLRGITAQVSQFAQANERAAERRGAVDAVRSEEAYDGLARQEWRRLSTEADLSDENTLTGYMQFLDENAAKLAEGHSGTETSNAFLARALARKRGAYVDTAGGEVLKAQIAKVDGAASGLTAKYAQMAGQNPGQVDAAIADYENDLKGLSAALPVGKEDALKKIGRAQITQSSVSALIDRQQFALAEQMLNDPARLGAMDPTVSRSLQSRIITARASLEKEERAGQVELKKLRTILGREPTAAERARAAGVAPPQGQQTLSGKIADFETVVKRPATSDEVAKLSGTYIAPSEAKKTLPDKVAEFEGVMGRTATDDEKKKLADAYIAPAAQGRQTLPDKVKEFEAAAGRPRTDDEFAKLAGTWVAEKPDKHTTADKVAEFEGLVGRPATEAEKSKMAGAYIEPKPPERMFGGSLTGIVDQMFVEMTPQFAHGLLSEHDERRYLAGVNQYTQETQFQNPDTGLWEKRRPTLPTFVVEALRRRGIAVPGEQAQAGGPGQTGIQPPGQPEPSTGKLRTIWERSGNVTGPVSSIGTTLSRTPGVGQVFQTPMMTADRVYVTNARRDLVTALQNSPRYAEGERTAIEQETTVDPAFFDDPASYRNRMIGMDEVIEARTNKAFKTSQTGVSAEERKHALNVLNALMLFREQLGVPTRVRTKADYDKLAPGAEYVDPNNIVRRKGGDQQAPPADGQ